MRKAIILLTALLLAVLLAAPAMAADYSFESGNSTTGGFGHPTSVNTPVAPDSANTNTRRNKDAALIPPPYGVFSGCIPTDPSSPYHDNQPQGGFVPTNQELPPSGSEDYAPGSSTASSGFLPSTSQSAMADTAPCYYGDGSIGTLHVSLTGKTIKVYEGENMQNLSKGAGHFSSTSAWDGNVALAGHNRGSAAYFSFVKYLTDGDTMTFTTKYGSRTYEVISKKQINEWDSLPVSWSPDNMLTLITCVAGVPELRYCVVAIEIKQK